MTIPKGVGIAAATVLLSVAMTSCANKSSPIATPSDSPKPSASATTASPSADAASAASGIVRNYYAVRNQLRADSSKPLDLLKTVAISKELSTEQHLFTTERNQGLHQIGDTKIATIEVQSVNLDNSDPAAGKVPTVTIDVCYDVTGVDIVDKSGKSVVKPGRPNTGWIQYLVSNYQWARDPNGGWRVASSQDIERTPCAAS